MIAIIDYGAGNLRSVKKAFDFLNVQSQVVSSPNEASGAEKIVLPGVGAFGSAIDKLNDSGFFSWIKDWLEADRPFLGICLGMQLLFETSTESEGYRGLGAFAGRNLRFQQGKVPQIGWNQVNKSNNSRLFSGIENNSFFYFLHGFYISPENEAIVSATTDYFISYPSVIERGNVFAVQFHPEKSGEAGLALLKNWVELC